MIAATVLAGGTRHCGTPASSGKGAGLEFAAEDAHGPEVFSQRGLITASMPLPGLSSLLWDAAGIVTETGSPAAHLFESARSLGVPAVCGVTLPRRGSQVIAVDGASGLVATIPLFEDIR